jgi:hypothetical protein
MPGARCARSLVCKKQTHERSHHGPTGNHPAFPAQWFYGLLRALPGDHACLTPSPALLLADLTPALGRQNDTTWPSASALLVKHAARVHRIPPRVDDVAQRPSVGRDGEGYRSDLPPPSSEISEIQKWIGTGRCRGCAGWLSPPKTGGHGANAPSPTLHSLTTHHPFASDATHSISISIAGFGSALTTQVVRAG